MSQLDRTKLERLLEGAWSDQGGSMQVECMKRGEEA